MEKFVIFEVRPQPYSIRHYSKHIVQKFSCFHLVIEDIILIKLHHQKKPSFAELNLLGIFNHTFSICVHLNIVHDRITLSAYTPVIAFFSSLYKHMSVMLWLKC